MKSAVLQRKFLGITEDIHGLSTPFVHGSERLFFGPITSNSAYMMIDLCLCLLYKIIK